MNHSSSDHKTFNILEKLHKKTEETIRMLNQFLAWQK